LVHATVRTTWQTDKGKNDIVSELQISPKKCELPPEAFTLSAFGLPEPVSKAERIKFWVLINAVAIGLIVLAFWLRSRASTPKRR
jgi:hypothetical protein